MKTEVALGKKSRMKVGEDEVGCCDEAGSQCRNKPVKTTYTVIHTFTYMHACSYLNVREHHAH